jgi:hypothetical protein
MNPSSNSAGGTGTANPTDDDNPRGRAQDRVDRTVSSLVTLIGSRTASGLTVAVEAESRGVAWSVADRVEEQLHVYRRLRLKAWRFADHHAQVSGMAADLLAQCADFESPPPSVFRRWRGGTSRIEQLRQWIEDSGWQPAMQPHLDAAIRAWIQSDSRRILLVIEGLDAEPEIATLLRQILYVLVTDPQTVTILPGVTGKLTLDAWSVDLISELPPPSPADFEAVIAKEIKRQFPNAAALFGDNLERWARVIRDGTYPDAARAVRIVSTFHHVYDQASEAFAEPGQAEAVPSKDARRLFFMVLLSHRFGEFTDRVQSRPEGVDVLVRIFLIALGRLALEQIESDPATADSHQGTVTRESDAAVGGTHWRVYAESHDLHRFVRDCFAGLSPLVEPFLDRHVAARYLWSSTTQALEGGYAALAQRSLTLFLSWVRRRSQGSRASLVQVRTNSELARSSDDYGLMTTLALYRSAEAMLDSDEAGRLGALDEAARLADAAIGRARRAEDRGGEMRGRGALAVVWTRLGRMAAAQRELVLAKALATDAIERVRLSEFEALCVEASDTLETAIARWAAVRGRAERFGMKDLIRRTLEADVRLASRLPQNATTAGAGFEERFLRSLEASDERLGASTRARGEKPVIALSYVREVAPIAKGLFQSLAEACPDCAIRWDQDFEAGHRWLGQIYEMFASADIAILLLDRRYFQSDPCRFEFNLVDARRGECTPLCVHLDDMELNHAMADAQAIVGPPLLDKEGRYIDGAPLVEVIQTVRNEVQRQLARLGRQATIPSSSQAAARIDAHSDSPASTRPMVPTPGVPTPASASVAESRSADPV